MTTEPATTTEAPKTHEFCGLPINPLIVDQLRKNLPEHPVVVSMACGGEHFDIYDLQKLLFRPFTYTGFDINPDYICEANKARRPTNLYPNTTISFQVRDLTSPLPPELVNITDVVLFVNGSVNGTIEDHDLFEPGYFAKNETNWQKIFENGLAALKSGGFVVIATLQKSEYDTILTWLTECGIQSLSQPPTEEKTPYGLIVGRKITATN